ncbi:hypothetical protein [Methanoculleus sp. DTU007]|jgi:hypothetical protein|uniref:hypothetical protein n=1 Tax=Methanoculleus TaxID=45989 RepID=UPI000A6BEC20|nr:hypothetical protein [Methanoculleus sp. DTU007]NLN08932.1 hypothetical protein [Methanoculleus thermophilus]
MMREVSSLLIAVIICIILTGAVIVYITLQDGGAPPSPGLTGPSPTPTSGIPVATEASEPTTAPRTFSISVTPTTVTARPGDPVNFTLTVHPENGFAAPVRIEVSATALDGAYRDTRDLGTVSPPYPPVTYMVITPDLPPFVSTTTVDATVRATGEGIVQTKQVQLIIRR